MFCTRAAFLLVFSAIVLLHKVGVAESREIKVVIRHTGQEAVVASLRAELSALGIHAVVMTDEAGATGPESLETAAREIGAVAGMRVEDSGLGVEVWVSDSESGVNVATEVVVGEGGDRAEALLALKAVELLRASLMRIGAVEKQDQKAPRPEPEPEPAETDVAAPPILSFGVQPAATWGFSELPVTMHLHIHFHVRVAAGIGIRLFGLVPTLPMRIEEFEGVADVRVGLVAAGLFYEFLPATGRFQPCLGVALGSGLMRVRGHASGDYRDGDELLIFPIGHFAAGLAVSLNRVLSVRLDAMVGVALKRPIVRFIDRNITGWGRPVLSGMIGIEAWLF